jgi:hypothetical protein
MGIWQYNKQNGCIAKGNRPKRFKNIYSYNVHLLNLAIYESDTSCHYVQQVRGSVPICSIPFKPVLENISIP